MQSIDRTLFSVFILLVMSTHSTIASTANKLPLCPKSPNCVSSQATDESHYIEPFKIKNSIEQVWLQLQRTIESQPRTKIVERSLDSIYAEATSLIFRFVDDVHFVLDSGNRVIHVRSASRVGYGDLGINRKRVEAIREYLRQADAIE